MVPVAKCLFGNKGVLVQPVDQPLAIGADDLGLRIVDMAIDKSCQYEAIFVMDNIDPFRDLARHIGCWPDVGDLPIIDENDAIGFVDHAVIDIVKERIRFKSQIRAPDRSLLQICSSCVSPRTPKIARASEYGDGHLNNMKTLKYDQILERPAAISPHGTLQYLAGRR